MLPALISYTDTPWALLPPGYHDADLAAVAYAYAYNPRRRTLFEGLLAGAKNLVDAGCSRLFLDGSFVTEKPLPGDYDACWDPQGVDATKLDPVFLDFSDQRSAQKKQFLGEYFPSSPDGLLVGRGFLDLFQIDPFSGRRKGLIVLSLRSDPMLQHEVRS